MDDDALLRLFEDRTLPFGQWTHRTHVKVAYLYLRRYPLDEAIGRIRTGIRAYNAAHDVPEGPDSGYHETMTVAFMHVIGAVMEAYADALPVASADAFCDAHPQLLERRILRLFYSPGRFTAAEAKHRFVEPDLAPLPRAGGSGALHSPR